MEKLQLLFSMYLKGGPICKDIIYLTALQCIFSFLSFAMLSYFPYNSFHATFDQYIFLSVSLHYIKRVKTINDFQCLKDFPWIFSNSSFLKFVRKTDNVADIL